jgi:hypothetical protein
MQAVRKRKLQAILDKAVARPSVRRWMISINRSDQSI